MKKIIFISLIGIIGGLFSCEEALLEEPQSIAVETFYNTSAEIEAGIAAAYKYVYTAYPMYMLIVQSDLCYGRGSYSSNNDYAGFNATNISRSEYSWIDEYLSIRNANLIIMNAPEGKELTNEEKTAAVAEAKFIRALNYFELVRNYKGVPIRTEENFKELNVARASEEEVWTLIVSDLQAAESGLPDDAPVSGRASKWAAKSVLANVYFYRGMNSEAAAKSNEVIASNKYALVPVQVVEDFKNLFSPDLVTSTEEIFYKKYSHESGTSLSMMLHHPGSGYCGAGGYYALYTDFELNNFMKNWDDTNDLRRQLWYNWDIGLGENTNLTLKFIDPDASDRNSTANDFPLYRYADVLLLNAEAECLATGSVSATAVERLNMVHRRAYGYDPLVSSPVDFKAEDYNADSFAELVVLERGKEQQFEGKRWHDLKRLGATKLKAIIKESMGVDVADKQLYYPIPVAEMEYNDAIDPIADQNSGY